MKTVRTALTLGLAASCAAFLAPGPGSNSYPSRGIERAPSSTGHRIKGHMQASGLNDFLPLIQEIPNLPGPALFAASGLVPLGLRMYSYFSAQAMMARLFALFVNGTTVELSYGNDLRNIFYYPENGQLQKLILPTANPKQIDTIRQVVARLQAAAKANYSVVALPESFDKLDLDEGSVDCVVSTYMLCKDKNPEASFAKAMRLLKDGGRFVFVEPVRGEGLTAGIRDVLGKIHRATGLWSDPSLDLEGIVNRWDGGEGVEIDVQAEAKNFIADPHVWGVIIKKGMVFSPEEQKKRVARKGFSKKNGGVIQGV